MSAQLRDKIYLFIEANRLREEAVDGESDSWYDELEKIRATLDKLIAEGE